MDEINNNLSAEAATASSLLVYGPTPLIRGEDYRAYDLLTASVVAALHPEDAIENMLVQDVIDQHWEIQRLRRFKPSLYATKASTALEALLEPILGSAAATELISRSQAHDQNALDEVATHLATLEASRDDIAALTLSHNFSLFEGIDRMITNAEIRRSMALQELNRHRSAFRKNARSGKEDITSAEFEEAS